MIDINLNKICKSYGYDEILKNIDLTVKKGEKIALIGSNGCGKSTLLKIICQIENKTSGELAIRKDANIGYLAQLPSSLNITVKDYVYDTFKDLIEMEKKLQKLEANLSSDIKIIDKYTKLQEKFISQGGYEFHTKINKILGAFEISEDMLSRNFNTLSGGEKTICSLIKLLLIEPDILLLDEPTNHLDIKRISWLENYLKSYNGTVIIVSHDRYFIDKIVDKIILLTKRGIETYLGNYSFFIKENENRLMHEFKVFKDKQKIIDAMQKSIKKLQEFGRLCGDSGGEIFFRRAASIKKRLEKMDKLEKPDTKKKINLKFSCSTRTGNEVIKCSNLNLGFNNKSLIESSNFNVFYKEKIALIGENGTGKSTLLKEIINNNNSFIMGTNIKLGYIPQEIIFDNEDISVLEETKKYFIGPEEQLRSSLFKFLFVGDNIHKRLKQLSGGEKVRLKLFCLIQEQYNVLLLDEPTNHIDIDTREILEAALIDFNGTIVFISHDRYFINKVANQIIELENKKLNKYIGNYDEYIKQKNILNNNNI